jgi:hypothetical protein
MFSLEKADITGAGNIFSKITVLSTQIRFFSTYLLISMINPNFYYLKEHTLQIQFNRQKSFLRNQCLSYATTVNYITDISI